MNCPECKALMGEDIIDIPKEKDIVEMTLKCPVCKVTFFGTLYREERRENG